MMQDAIPVTPAARARRRGFDVVRIVAAGMVILSHAFLLPTGKEPTPLVFSDYGYTFGRLGVIVFFAVSGYLVCGSWLSDSSLSRFAGRRARRIYPGLVVMLLVVVFGIGPLVTRTSGYLAQTGTWEYLVRNLLIFPYDYHLPGVFTDLPLDVVNGVLWTLGLEVSAYMALAVAGHFGVLRRPRLVLSLAVVMMILGSHWFAYLVGYPGSGAVTARLELVGAFGLAAALRTMEWRPGPGLAAVCGGILGLSQVVGRTSMSDMTQLAHVPLSLVVVPCLVVITVYLGTTASLWSARLVDRGDPSYGMYVYGYVIQQTLLVVGLRAESWIMFFVVSLGLSMSVGYASWHLVEKRWVQRHQQPGHGASQRFPRGQFSRTAG